MSRTALALVALLGLAAPAAAQLPVHVRFRVQGVAASHQESGVTRSADGFGVGGAVRLAVSRVTLEASGYRASLDPNWRDSIPFDVTQGDLRLGVVLYAPFALEIGAGRRDVDPDLSAPGVGWYRFGAAARTPLTRLAEITLRGAYLVPRFDGGGEAGFSIEVGLAAAVGTPNGRVRLRGEYDFQRLDRSVGDVALPIQLTVARVGVDVGF